MNFYVTSIKNPDKPHESAKLLKQAAFGPIWGVEINSLEELMEFQEKSGHPIIVGTSVMPGKYASKVITIYDGHL